MCLVASKLSAHSGTSFASSIVQVSGSTARSRFQNWITASNTPFRNQAKPPSLTFPTTSSLWEPQSLRGAESQISPYKGVARSATAKAKMAASAGGLVATHGADHCIFCKIIRGELPSYKLLETDHAVAFLDAFPMREGHVLLVPKTHAPFITDLSPEDAAESLKELPRIARAVQKAYGAEGISVAQNNGTPAGQVVFHVHFHIFPREQGDGLLKWAHGSRSKVVPNEARRVQEKIKQHV